MTTLAKTAVAYIDPNALRELTKQGKRQVLTTVVYSHPLVPNYVALTVLDALSSIPEQGVKLVPVDPTEEMIDAACGKWANLYPAFPGEKSSPTAGEVVNTIYHAMLAAAPSHPAAVAVTDEMVERVTVPYDGFSGDVIGSYTTREGKHGVVVQQDGTRVVHVYGRSRIEAALVDRDRVK